MDIHSNQTFCNGNYVMKMLFTQMCTLMKQLCSELHCFFLFHIQLGDIHIEILMELEMVTMSTPYIISNHHDIKCFS